MSKYCPMCDQVTNCTDNCKSCLEELENETKEKHINKGENHHGKHD